MNFTGPLRKLKSKHAEPIEYHLCLGDEQIALNPLLGTTITIQYLQEIHCIRCQRRTAKSFHQGHCYPCYQKLLECNLCTIFPERCKHPQQECPDTWAHESCKGDHIVYVANSSGLKVGITRYTQMPTRWIDQGAIQAIPILKVKNRYESGCLEVILKKYLADKTNWRKMLSDQMTLLDMVSVKDDLLNKAETDFDHFITQHGEPEQLNLPPLMFTYPVLNFPSKLKGLSLEEEDSISGKLLGVKGQYLLFEHGVINIRKYSGYSVGLTVHFS